MDQSSSNCPDILKPFVESLNLDVSSYDFAQKMDSIDPLRSYRNEFHIPKVSDIVKTSTNEDCDDNRECAYFCGNSLGLQPKRTEKYINDYLNKWKTEGVLGHFKGEFKWLTIDDIVIPALSKITGSKEIEVGVMNTLTTNLHLMMVPFYDPKPDRYKIMIEKSSFPSDLYAVESQARFHGYDPSDAVVFLEPKEGKSTIDIDDYENLLKKHKFCLILLPGVQYSTGQFFDIEKMTKLGHDHGAIVGWDLAHAVGNVPLELNKWNVDFAVWCSYKYLNAGAGSIGGFFVHERHSENKDLKRFAGWWGHDLKTRFLMKDPFNPIKGAYGFRLSNPCAISIISLYSSVEIFHEVGMEKIREKSLLLTSYLEYLIKTELSNVVKIITPSDPNQRGSQLSLLLINENAKKIEEELYKYGVVVDARGDDIIRVSPAPLYNNFSDIRRVIDVLKKVLIK